MVKVKGAGLTPSKGAVEGAETVRVLVEAPLNNRDRSEVCPLTTRAVIWMSTSIGRVGWNCRTFWDRMCIDTGCEKEGRNVCLGVVNA